VSSGPNKAQAVTAFTKNRNIHAVCSTHLLYIIQINDLSGRLDLLLGSMQQKMRVGEAMPSGLDFFSV
jgi:hypothetical protein